MSEKLSDTEAMNLIHVELESTEWSSDTPDNIADIMRATGRVLAEEDVEPTREELIDLLTDDWEQTLRGCAGAAADILVNGFKGYGSMNHAELLKESSDAGLLDNED